MPSDIIKPGEVDLNALIKDGQHFARQNPDGLVEVVDSMTGHTVAVLGSVLMDRTPILETRTLANGKTLLVESTVSAATLSRFKETVYHPWLIDIICQKLVEKDESSLSGICKEPGMPSYSLLMSWREKYPEIDKKLQRAREDRAERLRDKAVKTAMDNEDHKFPTQAAKLKVDTLFTAAGFDNSRFSPKAKVEATIHAPTQIIVQTGIDRTQIPPNTEPVVRDVQQVDTPQEEPSNGHLKFPENAGRTLHRFEERAPASAESYGPNDFPTETT